MPDEYTIKDGIVTKSTDEDPDSIPVEDIEIIDDIATADEIYKEEEKTLGVGADILDKDQIKRLVKKDDLELIGSNTSGNKGVKCSNCNRGKHCIHGMIKSKNIGVRVEDTCSTFCMCRCRIQYKGRDGRLRKFGNVDDSFTDEQDVQERNPETDKKIEALNAQFTALKQSTKVIKKDD